MRISLPIPVRSAHPRLTLPSCVFAADVDGDGDTDVLSAARTSDDTIAWYENDGSQALHRPHDHHRRPTVPDQRVCGGRGRRRRPRRAQCVEPFDDKIAWYENNGSENFTAPHDHHGGR